MSLNVPLITRMAEPLLGFRFSVVFLSKYGLGHPLDFRFQSISGLSVSVDVERAAGTNIGNQSLPDVTNYSNLVLKRGRPFLSMLSIEVQSSLNNFRFEPRNVLIMALNENAAPTNSWIFIEAYPVKWSVAGFDADNSGVLIEEMELSYASFRPLIL